MSDDVGYGDDNDVSAWVAIEKNDGRGGHIWNNFFNRRFVLLRLLEMFVWPEGLICCNR
jgi:hypothetical protein